MRIEIDCDGVLLNMIKTVNQSSTYGRRLTELGVSFADSKFWDLHDLPEEAKKVIFAAFNDPYILGDTIPYAYTKDFLTDLVRGTAPDVDIVLHTVSPEICVEARKLCLARLLLSLGCDIANRIDIQVDEGTKVMLHNSTVLIEDSPKNLLNSDAYCKILVDHPYNQAASYPDLQTIKYARGMSMTEVLKLIFESLANFRANALKNLDLTSELLYELNSNL